MSRLAWIAWLLLVHAAAGVALYQNRDRLSAAQAPAADSPPPHYRYQLRAHTTIDPWIEAGAVIFLGDSIIEGLNTRALAENSVNFGISHDTTAWMLNRLDTYASIDRAALVVLAVGVNDLVSREVDAVAADYRRIVERIAPRAPLLLSAVLPVDEQAGWAGLNARIDALNARIAALAEDRPRVSFVDAGSALRDAGGNLRDDRRTDAVHLNVGGYRAWIDVLRGAISKMLITN